MSEHLSELQRQPSQKHWTVSLCSKQGDGQERVAWDQGGLLRGGGTCAEATVMGRKPAHKERDQVPFPTKSTSLARVAPDGRGSLRTSQ